MADLARALALCVAATACAPEPLRGLDTAPSAPVAAVDVSGAPDWAAEVFAAASALAGLDSAPGGSIIAAGYDGEGDEIARAEPTAAGWRVTISPIASVCQTARLLDLAAHDGEMPGPYCEEDHDG